MQLNYRNHVVSFEFEFLLLLLLVHKQDFNDITAGLENSNMHNRDKSRIVGNIWINVGNILQKIQLNMH